MQEFDEDKAIAAMSAMLDPGRRDADAVCEVLDIIFDYYEENGLLDIDLDDESDDEPETEAIVAYASRHLAKRPAAIDFTDEELAAMVRAEVAYEESLL